MADGVDNFFQAYICFDVFAGEKSLVEWQPYIEKFFCCCSQIENELWQYIGNCYNFDLISLS